MRPERRTLVLLTNGYWQRTFGGDRGVLERVLTINGRPHQIIGVMPAEFRFGGEPDIILPLRIDRRRLPVFAHLGVARLKPGVTLAQANADVDRMIPIWFEPARANRAAIHAVPAAPQTGRRRQRGADALGPDGDDRHRAADGLRQRRATCCWCARTHGGRSSRFARPSARAGLAWRARFWSRA